MTRITRGLPRLAIVTTVYPGVEPFLEPWYASVEKQTTSAFDVCVVLDGLTPDDVRQAGGPRDARWIAVGGALGIGAVRQAGFEAVLRDYDVIVSVDADDELEPERVDAARNSIAEADVVATWMRLIGPKGEDLGVGFTPPVDSDWETLLPSCNVVGMSNSTWRADVLASCLPIPAKAEVVDWYLATIAAASGARMVIDPAIRMRYRQHGNNIARVIPPFTCEQIRRASRRVIAHCESMTLALLHAGGSWLQRVQRRLEEVRAFLTIIGADAVCADYTEKLNRLPGPHLWWEPVAHRELTYIWKN